MAGFVVALTLTLALALTLTLALTLALALALTLTPTLAPEQACCVAWWLEGVTCAAHSARSFEIACFT